MNQSKLPSDLSSQDEIFLTEDLCGIVLRAMVSRGHILIARVLQASNEIPNCFRYDYTLQQHEKAKGQLNMDGNLVGDHGDDSSSSSSSVGGGSGVKHSLSSMWKKISTKMNGNGNATGVGKILTRQADSYIIPDIERSVNRDNGGDNDHYHDDNVKLSGTPTRKGSKNTNRTVGGGGAYTEMDLGVGVSGQADVDVNADAKRYKSILVDFRYLTNPELYDGFEDVGTVTEDDNGSGSNTSNSNSDTESAATIARRKHTTQQEYLEQEFISRYQPALVKFYTLFTDICNYYHEMNAFVHDLDTGHYVQYTIESLLTPSGSNMDTINDGGSGVMVGRQLLCEMLYLYANILILLDLYIPGTIRERLIIAHHRYSDGTLDSNIPKPMSSSPTSSNAAMLTMSSNFETICNFFQKTNSEKKTLNDLLAGTSSSSSSSTAAAISRPSIPDGLLTRMPLLPSFVDNIVLCLMTQEIYPLRGAAFPSFHQNHQSAQLATQAYMIFTILFFQPMILKNNEVMMRRIVDRFNLGENWMIPLYNGHVMDLSIEWNGRFPAAQRVLEPSLRHERVRQLERNNAQEMKNCTEELKRFLNQNICPLYLLEHDAELLDCMRKTNIALRWRILHNRSVALMTSLASSSSASQKSLVGKATMVIEERNLVDLFLLASRYESLLTELYKKLLIEREALWGEFKNLAKTKMQQLSSHFSGNESLVLVEKNDAIGQWFGQMGNEIDVLQFHKNDYFSTGREVQFCIDSLNDMIKLDVIDRNAQVKEVISEASTGLLRMVKLGKINDDICSIIDIISDCEYARTAMEYYVPIFHLRSMKDPKSVALLRPSFLKMASFLSKITPRLSSRCHGHDLVKNLHTQALLSFVKEILDVIPKSIFSCLGRIVDIKENKSLTRLPSKIEVDKLWDYAHLDDRYNLAKLTFELSVLTKGIIDMEEIGSLHMNPQNLLEEGLRKELVRQISHALHSNLQFPTKKSRSVDVTKNKKHDFDTSFRVLEVHMQRFQSAIIWLQDFLRINGLEIYLQESTRVIWHSVNLELRGNKPNINTPYSNVREGVHIPIFSKTFDDPKSATFMGRVVAALTRLIDPRFTIHSYYLGSWFSFDGEAICDAETFALIRRTIGVQGLVGIDTLLSQKVANELRSLFQFYNNSTVTQYGVTLEKFRDGVFPEWKAPKHGRRIYESAINKIDKLMVPLLSFLCRLGQLQLLRKMVQSELQIQSRLEAPLVFYACSIANRAVIKSLKDKDSLMMTEEFRDDLKKTANLSRAVGAVDPMSTIFLKTDALEGLPSLLALFIIKYMSNVTYDSQFGTLRGKGEESFDGWSIVTGISITLRQFHPSYTKATLALLSQYLICSAGACLVESDEGIISKDVKNILIFMRQICTTGNIKQSVLHDHIPIYLMEMLDREL